MRFTKRKTSDDGLALLGIDNHPVLESFLDSTPLISICLI